MSRLRSIATLGAIVAALTSVVLMPSSTQRAETPSSQYFKSGIYVYYDWRNLDPSSFPWIRGGEFATQWKTVEPVKGTMDWSSLDDWLDDAARRGKGTVIKVTANDREHDGVPDHVYAAGIPKVWIGSYYYPKWWDPTFVGNYTSMIGRLGQKYDGDPRVSAVAISIGEYGEAMPGYGSVGVDLYAGLWTRAGLTADIWADYNKQIIDAYVSAFPDKPLFLQEQTFPSENAAVMWMITSYAASKGVHMGFNGLEWDNSKASQWYSPFSLHVESGKVMGRLEQGRPKVSGRELYWSILNALRNHASIISFYTEPSMDWRNREAFDFGNRYAGTTLSTTPGVWIALKEAGPGSWKGHQGNYEFWMYQIDPAGSSVALYEVDRSKEGMFARRTDLASGKNYFVFDIDDRYLRGGPYSVRVSVTYFDLGTDSFELQYSSASDPDKNFRIVPKGDTGTWKVATFELDDAVLDNSLWGGDLLLYSRRDGDDIFHLVEVTK